MFYLTTGTFSYQTSFLWGRLADQNLLRKLAVGCPSFELANVFQVQIWPTRDVDRVQPPVAPPPPYGSIRNADRTTVGFLRDQLRSDNWPFEAFHCITIESPR